MEHQPSILDTTTKEMLAKLNKLNQLAEQTKRNELEMRDSMLRNNADLKNELDKLELNHKKAIDICKSAAVYLN